MIKTKSVYDLVNLESDGFRVLVMRKWPRGIGYKKHAIHKWTKEVGPSMELLRRWNRSEITWEDCVKQYCADQQHSGQDRNRLYSENVDRQDGYPTVQGT
jgi:uncharacterized protein YeaO (DUF488 family)